MVSKQVSLDIAHLFRGGYMDLSWGSHIVSFRKYQLRLKELGLHLNKSLKHRRCISLVCMVWSFFVRWIELQPKEKKNIEESRCTERNSEKRWKEQSSDSQEPPSFYFDSFWRLSYISAIGFCETLLHTLFVVICLFYPFFTHNNMWRTCYG